MKLDKMKKEDLIKEVKRTRRQLDLNEAGVIEVRLNKDEFEFMRQMVYTQMIEVLEDMDRSEIDDKLYPEYKVAYDLKLKPINSLIEKLNFNQ